MDADLDTLATALYVRVDDLLKISPERAPALPSVGIAPRISDAELLILAVMSASWGFTSDTRRLRHIPTLLASAAAPAVHLARAAGRVRLDRCESRRTRCARYLLCRLDADRAARADPHRGREQRRHGRRGRSTRGLDRPASQLARANPNGPAPGSSSPASDHPIHQGPSPWANSTSNATAAAAQQESSPVSGNAPVSPAAIWRHRQRRPRQTPREILTPRLTRALMVGDCGSGSVTDGRIFGGGVSRPACPRRGSCGASR